MPEKSDKCKTILPAKVCNEVRKQVQQVLKDNGYKIPHTEIVVRPYITRDSKNKVAPGGTFSIKFGGGQKKTKQ